MKEWLKQKWPELIIVVVVIGGFVQMWRMNETLVRNEQLDQNLIERVDRIAGALPDVRVKLAYESIFGSFRTALFVTKPYQDAGQWKSIIQVIDTAENKRTVYETAVADPATDALAWKISGSVHDLDSRAQTFVDMERFSADIRMPNYMPHFLDKRASFLIYEDARFVEERLKAMNMTYKSEESIEPVATWVDLTASTRANRGWFDDSNGDGTIP